MRTVGNCNFKTRPIGHAQITSQTLIGDHGNHIHHSVVKKTG